MKIQKLGLVILLIIALMVIPAMATPQNGNGNNGNGGGNGCGEACPIDIDVNNQFSPMFSPDVDVDNFNFNTNKNYNTNNNLNVNNNFNIVDVDQDQSQKQNQMQYQLQHQEQSQNQKQLQHQENTQIVTVPIPIGNDGGVLLSRSNEAPKVTNLDVGETKTMSRLMYPKEVLPIEVSAGDMISLRASSDVALYTIGSPMGDFDKINSLESVPTYDPFLKHGFDWGFVVPVDKIDYWTMKGMLTASSGATYVVVDNRAPMNSYTHIEVVISSAMPRNYTEPEPVVIGTVLKPDTFPTDAWGRAITS